MFGENLYAHFTFFGSELSFCVFCLTAVTFTPVIAAQKKKPTIPPFFLPAPPELGRGLSIVTDPNLHPHGVKGNSVSVATQLLSLFTSPLWYCYKEGRTKEIER